MDAAARAEINAAIAKALTKVARDIAADAARFAPVRTGALRASIADEPVQGNSVIIRASAEYAGYVELGTRNMAPQPFLKPALYRNRDLA